MAYQPNYMNPNPMNNGMYNMYNTNEMRRYYVYR